MLIDPTEKCKPHVYRTMSEISGTIEILNSYMSDFPEEKQDDIMGTLHSLENSLDRLKDLV